MAYCSEPLLDCNDATVQASYFADNKTVYDCWFERREYVAGRIYLAVAIFNGVGIIVTTCLFVYRATSSPESDSIPILRFSAKKIQQIWKRHSLQKRSVMGTVLGAIGHFIFSTGVLLGQALSGSIGCEVYQWSVLIGFYTWMYALITTAHRLWFLFRINQLKVKYVRMSEEERLNCANTKDYKWYIKHRNKIGNRLMRPYIIYIFTILIILAISIPLELSYYHSNYDVCDYRRSAGLLIAYYGFYVAIVVPCLLWFLRHNADFHGIRREIWIDAVISIPYFILYIVFTAILGTSSLYLERNKHVTLFAAANWIVFFTAAAHIVSVVVPIVTYLPIHNRRWILVRDYVKRRCTLFRKQPTSSSIHPITGNTAIYSNNRATISRASQPPPSLEMGKSETSLPIAASSSIPTKPTTIELSVESLERCMSDPDMMQALQDMAIRDFSSENILFYETYLSLESKLRDMLYASEGQQVSLGVCRKSEWKQSFPTTKKNMSSTASTADILIRADSKAATAEDIEQQRHLQEFWETPIPYNMYHDFVQLYEYFIREDTPSQVNISYRARHRVDIQFKKLYRRYPEINPRRRSEQQPRTPSSHSADAGGVVASTISSPPLVHRASHSKDMEEQDNKNEDEKMSLRRLDSIADYEQDIPVLTMGLFEPVRREVSWNIFNSVYPKFVELYNNS